MTQTLTFAPTLDELDEHLTSLAILHSVANPVYLRRGPTARKNDFLVDLQDEIDYALDARFALNNTIARLGAR